MRGEGQRRGCEGGAKEGRTDNIFLRYTCIPDSVLVYPYSYMATQWRVAQRILLVYGKCCCNNYFGFDDERNED